MATRLDLDEQEQLDSLKHLWKQYGNLITWLLVLVLGSFAAFQGWQRYQQSQGLKAAALYEALDQAVSVADETRIAQAWTDLQTRYPKTAYAGQGGLLAARAHFDADRQEAARTALAWVAAHASEAEYRAIAQLRLAGLLMDDKQHDEALKQLPANPPADFAGLVADRRGDILQAQGKSAEAIEAYRKALSSIPETVDYRRVVEAKLTALGGEAAPAVPAGAASGAAR